MKIQDYLTATIQNIQTLIRETERRVANAGWLANAGIKPSPKQFLNVLSQTIDRFSSRSKEIKNFGFVFA